MKPSEALPLVLILVAGTFLLTIDCPFTGCILCLMAAGGILNRISP